jgi:hypothetical protein
LPGTRTLTYSASSSMTLKKVFFNFEFRFLKKHSKGPETSVVAKPASEDKGKDEASAAEVKSLQETLKSLTSAENDQVSMLSCFSLRYYECFFRLV